MPNEQRAKEAWQESEEGMRRSVSDSELLTDWESCVSTDSSKEMGREMGWGLRSGLGTLKSARPPFAALGHTVSR